ncbi:hypothetical protein B0A48_04801 [Cryoendolithus antarcticus]|uniref:Uncharacterized protein n=1 Tax=Cryoendolithus antarcticus TaxID=1507870 RepID=A0A1V8TDF4_9PEZI|nr:hypothetical protein B0A48_04801 [Cryoendolithus antarcticus]
MSRPRKIARKDDGSRYLARMDVDDTHTEATDLGAAGEEVNTENIDVDADENDVHFDGNLESFEDSPNVQRPYHADDLWSLEWFERLVLWDPASASAASQRDHVPKVQVLGRRGLCDICLDIFKDCAVDSWGDDDTAEYFPGHDFEDTRGLCLGDFAS